MLHKFKNIILHTRIIFFIKVLSIIIIFLNKLSMNSSVESWTEFFQSHRLTRPFLSLLSKKKVSSASSFLFFKSRLSKPFIKKFIKTYKINPDNFEPSYGKSYNSLNDFFIRKFKPGLREFSKHRGTISSPCEGNITYIPNATESTTFFVKDKIFNLRDFLGKEDLSILHDSNNEINASMVIIRLLPEHYHRIHMPISGQIVSQTPINGKLLSVRPVAFTDWQNPLIQNYRIILECETEFKQKYFFVVVGAMFVGSIVITAKIKSPLSAGDEIGYFEFGGSTIALVFNQKDIAKIYAEWNPDAQGCLEKPLLLGSKIGELTLPKLPANNQKLSLFEVQK